MTLYVHIDLKELRKVVESIIGLLGTLYFLGLI